MVGCQDAQSETALRLATCLTLSGPSTVSGTLSEAVKMTKNWKIAVNVLLTENVTLIQTPMERKIQPSAAVPRAKVQNILVQNFVTANLISLGLYGTCRRSLGCTLRSNRRHHHCKDHLNHNCDTLDFVRPGISLRWHLQGRMGRFPEQRYCKRLQPKGKSWHHRKVRPTASTL